MLVQMEQNTRKDEMLCYQGCFSSSDLWWGCFGARCSPCVACGSRYVEPEKVLTEREVPRCKHCRTVSLILHVDPATNLLHAFHWTPAYRAAVGMCV